MNFFPRKSLQVQLIALGATAVIVMSIAAAIVLLTTRGSEVENVTLRFMIATIAAGLISLVVMAFGVRRALVPLDQLRQSMLDSADGKQSPCDVAPRSADLADVKEAYARVLDRIRVAQREHEDAKLVLAQRTRIVDHLLEFSQTIQGAGKADQIFAALTHFLHKELDLAGLVILAHEAESVPKTQIRAAWPETILQIENPVAEIETSLCPCLRQCLPKCFRPGGSPVRCAVDSMLTLDASHPAYCVPFTIGRKTQVLVHMLLPPDRAWTEELRQLAQTYVNTAHSSLILLNMISEAEQQSMTDSLTGLYNRRSLDELLEREVALCERHSHPLALVMIDMDNFKQINDAHGHAAGDHMLKAFADCVRITLRKTDLAFRYGGDEFVLALPQTGVIQAQQVVTKVRQAFASVDFSSAIANLDHQPTLSIGVAERTKQSGILTLPQLLAAADAALYDAKSANRNCIRIYQPTRAAS